jgi:hypothetical protein
MWSLKDKKDTKMRGRAQLFDPQKKKNIHKRFYSENGKDERTWATSVKLDNHVITALTEISIKV